MPAGITFNDGSAATLTNGKPAPADRFAGWRPWPVVVGPRHTTLATGALHVYRHRTDSIASLALRRIPQASLDIVWRLMAHLDAAGVVTVTTNDAGARVYTNCCLAPDARAELAGPDKFQEYELRLTLLNLDGTALLAVY